MRREMKARGLVMARRSVTRFALGAFTNVGNPQPGYAAGEGEFL